MKRLLRLQDVLLLGLSGAVDLYNELKDPFGTVGDAYQNLYGWIPKKFKKTDYYQTVYHSLRTGYIEKVFKNGQPCLRLTSAGREKIQRDFSLVRWQNKKWDGKWRAVIFDIEEKQKRTRNVLRKKLQELGFGMLQESVWISPYDIALDFREFIRKIGLEEKVFAIEVGRLLAGDPKILAARIWSLEEVNSAYEDLFNILTNLCDRIKLSKSKEEEKKLVEELKNCRNKYLEILRDDPCLPKELLSEDWFGEKVKNLLRHKIVPF